MFRLNSLHTGIGRFKALFAPKKHGLLPRICNWVVLKGINSGNTMLIFNTHLDNKFSRARINGLKRISQCIQSLQKLYSPNTTILMGDFNTNLTYNIQQCIRSLHDTRQHAKRITGPHYTHPGWDHDQNSTIDHILISANKKNCVETLEIIDYSPTGLLLSDHWPVKVVLTPA